LLEAEVWKGENLTRVEKAELISNLETEFKSCNAVIVCDYKGMTVKELENLRGKARENSVKVRVLNNKLTSIALNNSEITGIDLMNTNIGLWGEDAIAVCKTAVNYAKDNAKLIVKSGAIDKEVADVAKIEAFAKLPGREELLGMLLSVWTAPARNFVTGLDNLRAKLEEEQ
jgi:large subunit ribosomal protein L10